MPPPTAGKRERGAGNGQQASQVLGRKYDYSVMVASVMDNLSMVKGLVNGRDMVDSGSSISLLQMSNLVKLSPTVQPSLVTASGDPLHIVDYVQASVKISELDV